MHQGLAIWMKGEVGLAGPALALPVTKDCSISVNPLFRLKRRKDGGIFGKEGKCSQAGIAFPEGQRWQRTGTQIYVLLLWGHPNKDSSESWQFDASTDEMFHSFINSLGSTQVHSVTISFLAQIDDGGVHYFL